MRRGLWARLTLASVVLALPATADAPRDPAQYEQFDRYSTEIEDHFTKLVWDRFGVLKDKKQSEGDFYCSATVFPGAGRLPTVKELLTLVDEEPHEEHDSSVNPPKVFKTIDQGAFPDTPTQKPYWTSTLAANGQVFTVNFATGKTELRSKDDLAYTRCVR
jgi:hypothetical protein